MSKYRDLINGQYANNVLFVQQVGGLFFGNNFRLSESPTTWRLRLGRYKGRYSGKNVDIHGYWIFRSDAKMCWQAVNYGDGALQYWNEDGRATGSPQDWELFSFREVDEDTSTVKIYNAAYKARRSADDLHYADHNFINLVGDTFSCNDKEEHAAIFTVKFQ